MSSAKVDVIVRDGTRRLESLTERPVRLMPNERAGVVYAGEVYPLYSDKSIDLSDPPVKKALCYRFVPPTTRIPYAAKKAGKVAPKPAIARWYLESNRFGHYIVFDGSRSVASDLVDRLRKADIDVVRWDESVRSADNGESYDWFIRLDFDGTGPECREAVAHLVKPGAGSVARLSTRSAPTIEAAAANVELLLARLERDQALRRVAELEPLAERAAALEKSAVAAKARNAKVERRVGELESQLTQQAETWTTELQSLHARLKSARAERDLAQRQSVTSERVEQLLEAKIAAENEWELATEEADALRTDLEAASLVARQLREKLELREIELELVKDDLAETGDVERERRARRSVGTVQGGSFEEFMENLLPRTDIDPDDLDLLLRWPSPRDAVRELLDIDHGGRPVHSGRVEGRPGWTEVRGINTGKKGKENLGRIYFRPIKASQRVRVCLHDKEDKNEQSRFIERLPDV